MFALYACVCVHVYVVPQYECSLIMKSLYNIHYICH